MCSGRHQYLFLTVLVTVSLISADAASCGGNIKNANKSGSIFSPNYPSPYNNNENCVWRIQVEEGYIVTLTFHRPFELERSEGGKCSHDSVEVFEITSNGTRNLLGAWCGTNTPPDLVSSTSTLEVKFRSDHAIAGKGFFASYVSADKCERTFDSGEKWGSFHSPNYPSPYGNHINCNWSVKTEKGYVIKLVFNFKFSSWYNCTDHYLKVYELLSNGNKRNWGPWCSGSSIGNTVLSESSQIYVEFQSDRSMNSSGFSASWFRIDKNCGGTFTTDNTDRGLILPPNYPSPYDANKMCKWTINNAQNHLVKLAFFYPFDVGNECLQVQEVLYTNQLNTRGTWCGPDHPPDITYSSPKIDVIFNSDNTSTSNAVGFSLFWIRIDATQTCEGTYAFNNDYGYLHSPHYPDGYSNFMFCKWTINVGEGYIIKLMFRPPFNLEGHCYYDSVMVFNVLPSGVRKLIGSWCGNQLPPDVLSTTPTLDIEFRADFSNTGQGFYASWIKTARSCVTALDVESGTIRSPNYPFIYPPDLDCEWEVEVPRGQFIQLEFSTSFNLGLKGDKSCSYDEIEVFDVFGNNSLISRGHWCGTDTPPQMKSFGSKMVIKFHSDSSNLTSGSGFHATWTNVSECSQVFKSSQGYIMSYDYNNTVNSTSNCVWEIEGDHSIILKFDSALNVSGCEDIEMLDYSVNPQQQKCDENVLIQTVVSLGQWKKIILLPKGYNSQGFFASWTSDCGNIFSMEKGNFTSPNYGQDYPNNMDCEWQIKGTKDHNVHLYFHSPFELEATNDDTCRFDYVEVMDVKPNGTVVSKGRFCGLHSPPPMISSSSALIVRFHSDGDKTGKGFYATWNTACGDIYRYNQGNITSPQFPRGYPDSFDCRWEIQVDQGSVIKISFEPPFSIEDVTDCSSDYVELYDVTDNGALVSRGKWCGDTSPPIQISRSFKVVVVFHSDGRKNGAGFHIVWESVCRQVFYAPQGNFSSPGFPSHYPDNLNCQWDIGTTPGNRVKLQFGTSFDLELNRYGNCGYDDVEVMDYFANGSLISRGKWCGDKSPPVILSLSSRLAVLFHSDNNKHGMGFSISWDTVDGCGDIFHSENGYLMTPNYPEKYPPSQFCRWEIYLRDDVFTTFHFDPDFEIEKSSDCSYDYVQVFHGNYEYGKWCGSAPPSSLRARGDKMVINFQSDNSNNRKGFFASWSTSKI